jgi:ABC-type uncharacterized transport system substrate-binding protein
VRSSRGKPRTIGFLGANRPSAQSQWTAAFVQRLREFGWPRTSHPPSRRSKGRAQALYVAIDPLTVTNRIRINTLAQGARMPTMYALREYVEAGGLMSYGPNLPDLFRRAADYVDKILRGAKPADIPIEQPTKFDLVINLTTAKAIGLSIPESFLLRADEVIE